MAAKYRQISLKDTFLDCQNMFIDNTPTFFQLLDEHFDLNEFIPSVISNAFCQHLRRKKTYPLTRFLSIVGQLSRQIFMPFIMNLVNVCSSHEHTIPFIA